MSETTITKEQITIDQLAEAMEVIAETKRLNLAAASEEIAKILDEYEVDLLALLQIIDGRIVAQIQLVNKQ